MVPDTHSLQQTMVQVRRERSAAVVAAPHLAGQISDGHGGRALRRVRLLQEVTLEVEVVDRAKRAQRVVPEAEERAPDCVAALKCEEHRGLVDDLRDAVVDARHQQHVAVLDGRDVDQDKVWRRATRRCAAVVRVRHGRGAELEEDLLHCGLAKIELARVEGLADSVHAKFRWSLLRRTAFVQLRNEAVDAVRALRTTRGMSCKSSLTTHSIAP